MRQMNAYSSDFTKHCHGKSYAIINHSKGGGVLNHVTDAPKEMPTTPIADRELMRYNHAQRLKGQWADTEYPVDHLEIVEVV